MSLSNPFFQMPQPTTVKYKDVPLGGHFTHDGKEFVRVHGGHIQLRGRRPSLPHQLLPNTPVVR